MCEHNFLSYKTNGDYCTSYIILYLTIACGILLSAVLLQFCYICCFTIKKTTAIKKYHENRPCQSCSKEKVAHVSKNINAPKIYQQRPSSSSVEVNVPVCTDSSKLWMGNAPIDTPRKCTLPRTIEANRVLSR